MAPQLELHMESRGVNWTSAEAHMLAPPPSRMRIESSGTTFVASMGTRPGWIGVDRFGNLATNLPAPPGEGGTVEVGGCALELREHYAQAAAGELLALVGSDGRIEIACNRGRANERLRAAPGLLVVWRPPTGGSP